MFKINNLSKVYATTKKEVTALKNLTFEFPDKGFVFVLGKSGSGKSTLMSILGGIEKPTTGSVCYKNQGISSYSKQDFLEEVVFVFQDFNLILDFTVKENISIVSDASDDEILTLLQFLNLEGNIDTPVRFLSGGERQRLSIARALAKNASVVLLDEPTGNLDSFNSTVIMDELKRISQTKLVIMVTHDNSLANLYSDITIELEKGSITRVFKTPKGVYEFDNLEDITPKLKTLLEKLKSDFYKDKYLKVVNKDNKEESLKIDKEIEKKIIKLIADSNGEVTFILENDNEDLIYHSLKTAKKLFTYKKQLKYAFRILRLNKGRLVVSMILMFFALVLLFIASNITFANPNKILIEALKDTDHQFLNISLEKENEYTEDFIEINQEKTLYNEYSRVFGEENIMPTIIQNIGNIANQNPINMATYLCDEQFLKRYQINGKIPEGANEIVISKETAKYLFNAELPLNQTISFKYELATDSKIDFKIVGVIDPAPNILVNIDAYKYNSDYYYQNSDLFTNIVFTVFIPKTVFVKTIQKLERLIGVKGAYFPFSDSPTFIYFDVKSVKIGKLSGNESVVLGRKPTAENEILVSKNFYINDLKLDFNLEFQEKKYSYQDLNSSPNFIRYQGQLNYYDVAKEVTVVGVIDDAKIDYLISNETFNRLASEYLYTGITNISIFKNDIKKVVEVLSSDNGMITNTTYAQIYMLSGLIFSEIFIQIAWTLEVILLLLSGLLVLFFSSNLVHSKLFEIGILKSLGIRDFKITNVFLQSNLFSSTIVAFLALVVGNILLFSTNNLINSSSSIKVTYDMILVMPISVFLVLLIALFLAVIGNLIPFIQIKKLDIGILMKTYS